MDLDHKRIIDGIEQNQKVVRELARAIHERRPVDFRGLAVPPWVEEILAEEFAVDGPENTTPQKNTGVNTLWHLPSDGQPHLQGWMHTGIITSGGWLLLSICPLCHGLVIADKTHAFGDHTTPHEEWHARTDYPVPITLRVAITQRNQH